MSVSPKLLAEGMFKLKGKPGEGLCHVSGCRKPLKTRYTKLGLCHAHYQYRWRLQNPCKSAYATLRDHAKQRGIKFSISLDYFQGLCDGYAYFDHSTEDFGATLSIDRQRAELGYEPGNCRIITVSQNAIKSHVERYLPQHVQAVLARKRSKARQLVADEPEIELDPFAAAPTFGDTNEPF